MRPSRKILLVNDDPHSLVAFESVLKLFDFDVACVASAHTAIRAARANKPDIVVSDILMRPIDGFGLCHWIRRDSDLSGLPFILFSNLEITREHQRKATAVGANAVLSVSTDFGELVMKIRELVP